MWNNSFNDSLLDKVLSGRISIDSLDFCKWLKESKKNEDSFNKELAQMAKDIEKGECLDTEVLYKNIWKGINRKRITLRVKIFMQYVAVILLLFCIGSGILFWRGNDSLPDSNSSSDYWSENNLVTLILPEGKQVFLDKEDTLKQVEGGIDITSENGRRKEYISIDETSFNILKTPLACDFYFTLVDGTKIWMNALSSIRYPVRFAENERVVFVSGELYLEVAKDNKRPFYVMLENMKIEVLGTSFNINAYTDENQIEITLEKGHIRAYTSDQMYDLKPNRQLCMNRKTKKVDIKIVKPSDYISWKDGRYLFKSKPLYEVAKVLKRWYGIEMVFEKSELRDMVFTGVVDKEEPIDIFIKRLAETSRCKCQKLGQKIFIR